MPRADICKSFVRAEPKFHTKFCIKKHVHHQKVLCSFGGTAGGGGGGGGAYSQSLYAPGINHGNFAQFGGSGSGSVFSTRAESPFVPESATMVGHEHMHHPPMNSVPGPVVGSGAVGLVVLAGALMALARRRRHD